MPSENLEWVDFGLKKCSEFLQQFFKQHVRQLFQIIKAGKEMYFLVSYVELF